ncbi:hypothetical protein [Bradyrhizobium barranii]
MISFLMVCAVGLLAVTVANQLPIKWFWKALVALILTASLVLPTYLFFRAPTLGDQDSWATTVRSTPFREFILFGLLLVGMVARVVSVAIEKRGDEQKNKGLDIDRWQFIYPMLFAIPTFAGLLSQIKTPELSLTDIVLAFQTGFFWQTILKRDERS